MDSKLRTTQTDRIVRHITEYGSITTLEAINQYGIMRLSARIGDLIKLGYSIQRETVESKNRYGETVRYARYSFYDWGKGKEFMNGRT